MKVKHPKELRISEFSESNGGVVVDLKRNWTCHKIPHTWEGTPPVFQSGIGEPSHNFFKDGGRGRLRRRSDPAYKSHMNPPFLGGIGIGRPILTYSTLHLRAKVFPYG